MYLCRSKEWWPYLYRCFLSSEARLAIRISVHHSSSWPLQDQREFKFLLQGACVPGTTSGALLHFYSTSHKKPMREPAFQVPSQIPCILGTTSGVLLRFSRNLKEAYKREYLTAGVSRPGTTQGPCYKRELDYRFQYIYIWVVRPICS